MAGLSMKDVKKQLSRLSKSIMKSHRLRIPKYDMPVRFRPWFLVFTCIVMIILAFLGFTNFSHALPLNDKLLHFLCFGLATAVFYFIIDVEESSRRIWFWRHAGLIFTTFTCIFCGGILSEFVQATLPYKQFQWGDILANLCGSSLGLYIAYHIERYYRHRREIARLYRPLSGSISDLEDDDDSELDSTQLLPIHVANGSKQPNTSSRLADIWDEREELFEVRESDEETNSNEVGPSGKSLQNASQVITSHHS